VRAVIQKVRKRKRRSKKTQEELERGRLAVRECRDRQRKGFATFIVAVDEATLDMLISAGYLSDHEVIDKQAVGKALSRFIWDTVHLRLH
jgi:hypothetical protein